MNQPKPMDPLTLEEMQAAVEKFMPLFNLVHEQMPKGSTTEETLKVMEACAKLGHQLRKEKRMANPFGFNKKIKNETTEN